MGCGISRINLMEEGMACGLKRRIVQVRSRNDLILAAHDDPGTASTKMLLKDQNSNNHHGGDTDSSHSPRAHNKINNVSDAATPPLNIKQPPVQQQIQEKELADERVVLLEKNDVRLSNCESPLTKKMGSQDHEEHAEKETYETDDDHDDEYDDVGRRISNCDGAMLIGSPSFREYCVDYDSDHDFVVNNGTDDDSNGGNKENRTLGMDNLICDDEVCIRSQEPMKKLEKKGSRGSKFSKVFPMHKTRRHLLNMTTCYSRNNHHHVPIDKQPDKLV